MLIEDYLENLEHMKETEKNADFHPLEATPVKTVTYFLSFIVVVTVFFNHASQKHH